MKKLIATTLAVALTTTLAAPRGGWASLAPALEPAAAVETHSRAQDLTAVEKALESKLVQERLSTLGISRDAARERVSRMSDAELHQLATHTEALTPGGDALVLALVIAAGVLLGLLLFRGLGYHTHD